MFLNLNQIYLTKCYSINTIYIFLKSFILKLQMIRTKDFLLTFREVLTYFQVFRLHICRLHQGMK